MSATAKAPWEWVHPVRCENEGCARPVEWGEPYCAACGLERSLYDREARRREAADSPWLPDAPPPAPAPRLAWRR